MEQENNKLKRIVANLMLENEALKEVLKKLLRPSERRAVIGLLQEQGLSHRKACQLAGFSRSVDKMWPAIRMRRC